MKFRANFIGKSFAVFQTDFDEVCLEVPEPLSISNQAVFLHIRERFDIRGISIFGQDLIFG